MEDTAQGTEPGGRRKHGVFFPSNGSHWLTLLFSFFSPSSLCPCLYPSASFSFYSTEYYLNLNEKYPSLAHVFEHLVPSWHCSLGEVVNFRRCSLLDEVATGGRLWDSIALPYFLFAASSQRLQLNMWSHSFLLQPLAGVPFLPLWTLSVEP